MKALVTGGAGFIGSNLVDALVARGDAVAVVDTLTTGSRANLASALAAGVALHEVDIVDAASLQAVFDHERPEFVFHLAAQIDVRRSVADPAADARVNVEGTVNVLEAARCAGARRVVYSSTGGAIYGEAEHVPTPESTRIQPLSPYGQAKHAGEGYCGLYASLYGLSTLALRYANVYGPRQDPLGEGGVIAIFCGRVALGGRPTVYGDGEQTRDYVFVEDVVRANLAAAGSDATGAVNIGTGVETSVLDLVRAFDDVAANPFEPLFEPARAGEVRRSCLDAASAAGVLGWTPQTDLHAGLRRTLSYVAESGAVES